MELLGISQCMYKKNRPTNLLLGGIKNNNIESWEMK